MSENSNIFYVHNTKCGGNSILEALRSSCTRFIHTNDLELKELYKTLDGLEKNEKLSKENKIIIQEYLRILIKERLETNDSK